MFNIPEQKYLWETKTTIRMSVENQTLLTRFIIAHYSMQVFDCKLVSR